MLLKDRHDRKNKWLCSLAGIIIQYLLLFSFLLENLFLKCGFELEPVYEEWILLLVT